mgnify:CR=1
MLNIDVNRLKAVFSFFHNLKFDRTILRSPPEADGGGCFQLHFLSAYAEASADCASLVSRVHPEYHRGVDCGSKGLNFHN